MTCIVIHKDDRLLYMAGDRRGATGSAYFTYPIPKVVNNGGVLMGGSGKLALIEEILYNFEVPKRRPKETASDYIRKNVYPSILEHLEMQHYLPEFGRKIDSEEIGATFLLGYKDLGFLIDMDDKSIDLISVSVPFSIGSGGQFARGSLLTNLKKPVEKAISEAMRITSECDLGCSPEYDLIYTEI